MKKRTICIMGRILDQDDGLGVYASNLLEHMFRQDSESKYALLLRTDKCKDLFQHFPNVETIVLPAKIKTLWDQFTVPMAAHRLKADIIFNPKFSIPLFTKSACVFVLHGSDWYVNPQNYEWWDNIYIRIMMPTYCWKAKRLMAISQTIADDLAKYAHVNPSKVTTSYAAPSSHFNTTPDTQKLLAFKLQYNLPDAFIFTVARAYHSGHGNLPPYPGGNIENLISAYLKYRNEGGELPLVVAGERIKEYLLNNNFSSIDLEHINFMGFVPHAEINYAYNLATFFILSTLYESFAFPLVEAMASGCPAIVPNTGACPEVSGGATLLVDPLMPDEFTNAMFNLDKSAEKRDQLKELGLKQAATFTWENTAQKTLLSFNLTQSKN